MAWSNSREHREELQRELRDMRRELEDLKRGLAAKHAAQAREIEALRTKSDIAFERVLRTFKRYAAEQKAGFNPSQPRVSAGNADGGQWTATSNGASVPDANGVEPADASEESEPAEVLLVADRPKGHHFVNQSLYKNLPLPPETRKVFDEATTGPLTIPHGWSKEHEQYNRAVKESFDRFIETNKIQPEKMTPDQAKSFVQEVIKSPDPRIRNFNMRIMLQEFMRRPPRPFRGSET
jgi:hypothetical protein